MSVETPVDKTVALADAINRLVDHAKASSEAKAPAATQTPESAIKQEVNAANEVISRSASDDEIRAERRRLQDKLASYDSEIAERKNNKQRKSEFSLEDAKSFIAEEAHIPKTVAKGLFTRLGLDYTQRSENYKAKFGNRSPISLIMSGAFVPSYGKGFSNFGTLFTVGSEDPVLREAQELNDKIFIWSLHKQAKEGRVPDIKQCPVYDDYARAMSTLEKALDTVDLANWVPESFSTQLIERYDMERNVVRQLNTFQMPRSPFEMPVLGAATTTYLLAQNTADPESATVVPTSDLEDLKITLALIALGARTSWSYEVDEDSIIAIAGQVRDELASSMVRAEEDAIINGDTTATHQDADVTSAGDHRKAWLGLRKIAIAGSFTTDISGGVAESYMSMIKAMGKYGTRHNELFWIISPSTRATLLTLKDENDHPVMLGSAAPGTPTAVMTMSDTPSLFGVPVVVSELMRTDLNATGVHDGTTETKTGVLLVNRKGFVYAWTNSAPTVESQRWIRTRQIEVVASMRREFEQVHKVAVVDHVVDYGINLAN